MARLDAAALDLPVEPLRDGWYTDAYGVGSALRRGENEFPADLVRVDERLRPVA